jgi:hypothetical protein
MAVPSSGAPSNDNDPSLPDTPSTAEPAAQEEPVPERRGTPKNPPMSPGSREAFTKAGIFQGPDGVYYNNNGPMKNPDGTPMTEAEVKMALATKVPHPPPLRMPV